MRHPLLPIGSLLAGALIFNACVKPPPVLRGGPFAEIAVIDAQQRDLNGQRVRWGGRIASVETHEQDTCFEIVSRPLDREARPQRTDRSDGRFLACAAGFLDPEVYAPKRELTVIGTIESMVTRPIGEREYHYPSLQAEHVYLWPKRVPPPPYYYDPWFWPYGGSVIVVSPQPHHH
jgi:outer membrane lipoprotein